MVGIWPVFFLFFCLTIRMQHSLERLIRGSAHALPSPLIDRVVRFLFLYDWPGLAMPRKVYEQILFRARVGVRAELKGLSDHEQRLARFVAVLAADGYDLYHLAADLTEAAAASHEDMHLARDIGLAIEGQ